MISVLKKELRTFFSNATGYIVICIFLIVNGLFLWVIPGEYNVIDSGYANVDGLFHLAPWLFLFLCPGVSMRLFAEEKQNGTWELLVTKPLLKTYIVFGKYLASWLLVFFALIPVVLYYITVFYLAEPVGNVDSGAFWGSFVGLIFLSALYVAAGTFASALSSNQIVAFIISVVISFFLFYGFDLLTSFFSSGKIIQLLDSFGVNSHYKSMSRGVIDSRDILYFIVLSAGFLSATVWKVSK